jgi:hypothetical protein
VRSSSSLRGGGLSGWQDGGGIGSGLAKPGSRGNALRRDTGDSTNMVELLIRFLRLSALVAMELGSEAVDGKSSVDGDATSWDDLPQRSDKGKARETSSVPSAPSSPINRFSREPSKQTERERMHAFALRPSREWYMLCAGLVTRAVLEGYMTCGWTGLCAVETLMKVGLGLGSADEHIRPEENEGEKSEKEEDEFAELDPDDFPDLLESAKVLFPSLKNSPHSTDVRPKEDAETEYEIEMEERLARVRTLVFLPVHSAHLPPSVLRSRTNRTRSLDSPGRPLLATPHGTRRESCHKVLRSHRQMARETRTRNRKHCIFSDFTLEAQSKYAHAAVQEETKPGHGKRGAVD